MKKKVAATLVAMTMVGTMAVSVHAEGDEKLTVAFSQGDNGNSWRVTCTDDMIAVAEERGYELIWADAGADPSKQLSDVEDLLAQSPDILVVSPVESEACTPIVDLADEAGVPLITIDRAVEAEVGDTGTYIASIEQDFVEVGRLAAQYAVDYLVEKNGEEKGNVLIITGTVGASANTDEENGINEVLDQYPDIKILDNQSGDYSRAGARAVMDDYLNKYPEGEADVLICFNDEESFGAYQAMQDAGRTDLTGAIISKDGMTDAIGQVVEGNFLSIVQCTPYFGEVTFDLIDKVLAGEEYETHIDVPFTCFDMGENKEATEEYYQHLVDEGLDY